MAQVCTAGGHSNNTCWIVSFAEPQRVDNGSHEIPLPLKLEFTERHPDNAGPWQVMLKQSDGSFACVAESATRFTLGETKEELLQVLGLQEEKGSSLEFLRRGYKSATWWEEDVDLELSSNWRS